MTFHRFPVQKSAALILLLVVGLIAVPGCKKKSSEQTARTDEEKRISDMVSRATEGKADIDFKTGQIKVKTPEGDAYLASGGGTWPGDLPEEIPQFMGAPIQNSTNSDSPTGRSWTVIFKSVEPLALTAYIKDLTGNGWKTVVTSEVPNGTFTQLQRERLFIQLTYMTDEKSLVMNVIRSKAD